MLELTKLRDAVINGDAKAAHSITQEALSQGTDPWSW